MSSPFLGEIKMFAGNFNPRGFALCNGQLLSIQQNTALFSLLGTTYGGNGQTTFGLPDLRGRAPLDQGSGAGLTPRVLGEQGGEETVTLATSSVPAHTHPAQANTAVGTLTDPTGNVWATAGAARGKKMYSSTAGTAPAMKTGIVSTVGGTPSPHNNLMPYLAVTFIIALQGIFPSRN
jgi:microcystin-dependent protein